jgi:hypothetical protein
LWVTKTIAIAPVLVLSFYNYNVVTFTSEAEGDTEKKLRWTAPVAPFR